MRTILIVFPSKGETLLIKCTNRQHTTKIMRQESCFYYTNNKYRYGYTKCTRQTEQSTNSSISNRSAVMYCYLLGLQIGLDEKTQ